MWWLTEYLAVTSQMATILIIDDNSATRNILRTALSHAGYTVLVAATGVDGLEQCQEHPIDREGLSRCRESPGNTCHYPEA
jgi:CheY-like chemotaxis protein